MGYMIDTHCHFDDASFDEDREVLFAKLKFQGVSDLICPAISRSNWQALKNLREQQELVGIHVCYGLHPMYLQEHTHKHLQDLECWLESEQPVAVGECGLDYFVEGLDQQGQIDFFVAQLKYARDFDLPVVIHARQAVDHVLKYLRKVGNTQGVIHSFAGSQQQADLLMKQGFMLGIGGTVTYERAKRLRNIVSRVPDDFLLLETDSPDQPDSLWRGRRNEPSRLSVIAQVVAELRGVSPDQIATITTTNAKSLFKLPS